MNSAPVWLRPICLFTSCFALLAIAVRADQNLAGNVTVTGGSTAGNLAVTGAIDSDSNTFTFGTQGASFGAALLYQDASADTFTFNLNRSPASWLWQHLSGIAAMRLDANHQLIVYQSDGTTAGITLTPSNSSLKLGSLVTLTGDSSGVLTVNGPLAVAGNFTNTNGSFTGGASGLTLNAGGTNQNVTLNASGTGDLVFNAGGIERARIKSTGNVGIGTTSPGTSGGGGSPRTLEIMGSTGQTVPWGQLVLSTPNAGAANDVLGGIEFASRGVSTYPRAGYVYSFKEDVSTTAANANLQFGVTNGGAAATAMIIRASGNVGIGTLSPGALLDVAGPVAIGTTTSGSSILLRSYSDGRSWAIRDDAGVNRLRFARGSTDQVFWDVLKIPSSDAIAGQIWYANGAERIRLDSFGNVGIGTATPTSRLHVVGSPGIDTPMLVESQTTNAYVVFKNSAGDNSISASGNTLYIGGGGTAGAVLFRNGWTNSMMLTGSGNLGIGTTAPAATLHVLGQVGREVARFQGSADVSNNRNFISIYTTNPGYWWELSNQDPSGGGTLNGLAFRERSAVGNSIERVYFASGGNVGIGTTNPTQKLSVNGTIRAKEVIVDTGWADYVFDESYRLASLSEVESRIKAEKHLPGIPSAQEVAEHGVNMGEMQTKLLSKVEELTLHLIAQEKRLDQLEAENRALRAQLSPH